MITMSIWQMGTLRLRRINNWSRSPILGSMLEPEFGFGRPVGKQLDASLVTRGGFIHSACFQVTQPTAWSAHAVPSLVAPSWGPGIPPVGRGALLGLLSLPPPLAKLRSHRIWRDSSPQPQGQFLPGRGTQPGGQRTPGPGETKALGQLYPKGHKGTQTLGVGCLRIGGKLPAYQALRMYKATAQSFPGRGQ